MCLARDGPDDGGRATELLTQSEAIFRRCGANKSMDRVTALREQSGSRPSPYSHPDSLTQREVEVSRLLALGKSNGVIAEDLVLSVRTVERHISNIYAKTNCHGRANATAFAFTHGLMAST